MSELLSEGATLRPSDDHLDSSELASSDGAAVGMRPSDSLAAATEPAALIASGPPAWESPTELLQPSSAASVPRGVLPQCGCQGPAAREQLVFAIGTLGYDFGTEARRDSFKQLMPRVTPEGVPWAPGLPFDPPPLPPNPYDPRQIVNYLAGFPSPSAPFPSEGGFPRLERLGDAFPESTCKAPAGYAGFPAHPSEASELIWTLNIELTPIYAVRPSASFAAEMYQRLVEAFAGQILYPAHDDFVDRVSVSGLLSGDTVKLFSGQVVPVLVPHIRGMYTWNVNRLTSAALAAANVDRAAEPGRLIEENLTKFLNRIYYDLRNLGQTAHDRAMNFTATNVFQAATVFAKSLKSNMQLDTILVERSAFCRMDSDCWDVKFKFFDPENTRRARDVYRVTVDVSDVFPVTVGQIREWSVAG